MIFSCSLIWVDLPRDYLEVELSRGSTLLYATTWSTNGLTYHSGAVVPPMASPLNTALHVLIACVRSAYTLRYVRMRAHVQNLDNSFGDCTTCSIIELHLLAGIARDSLSADTFPTTPAHFLLFTRRARQFRVTVMLFRGYSDSLTCSTCLTRQHDRSGILHNSCTWQLNVEHHHDLNVVAWRHRTRPDSETGYSIKIVVIC